MQILFEDNYLLALHKPAGLSSESGASAHPSAETWAEQYLLQKIKPHPAAAAPRKRPFVRAVHRLDRPTGGILLLAKTKTALSHLMAQFEGKTVKKVYRAVLDKPLPLPAATLRHWLKRAPDGRSALVFERDMPGSQLAVLHYKQLTDPAGRGYLYEIELETGRFHQIRAQLAHTGCPVTGDTTYGGSAWKAHQIKLHAGRLEFEHPKTGQIMVLEAPETW